MECLACSKYSIIDEYLRRFPGDLDSKESTCNVGDLGSVPGSGRSPGEGNGNNSSILAWRIPWTEEPNGQQSMEFQRVGYVWWLTLFIGLYYIFLNKGHKEKPENLTELWGLSSLGSLGRFCLHYYLKSQIICWILRERWLRISHCTRRPLQNLQKEIHRAMSELSKIKKDSQLSLV